MTTKLGDQHQQEPGQETVYQQAASWGWGQGCCYVLVPKYRKQTTVLEGYEPMLGQPLCLHPLPCSPGPTLTTQDRWQGAAQKQAVSGGLR